MAVQKFTDAGIFYDKWNLTGDSNKTSVDFSADMLDGSTFGVGTKVNVPGLMTAKASVAGFWEVDASGGTPDPALFNAVGRLDPMPLSVYPANADLGVAYSFPVNVATFNFFGALGELVPFSAEFSMARYAAAMTYLRPMRGLIGLQPTQRSGASGNGSYATWAVIGATQCVQMFVHLFAFTGTNVTFNLVSDDNTGFSTPTTRVTSGAMSAIGSYAGMLAGPIATDTYWRIGWSGTLTNFTAMVTFGFGNL